MASSKSIFPFISDKETSESMSRVKIISDGGCDLPKYIADKLDVTVVPLSVQFGSETLKSDIEPEVFYDKMKKAVELPKTSSPSPGDFMKAFRAVGEDRDIVVISLSSGISSTYNHALMAKDMMLEEGYQGRIEIIDSLTASVGQGLLVYKTAKLAEGHTPLDEILLSVRKWIQSTATYFVLDTLDNVIRGGRLNRVRGTVASILNIKLFMGASKEGTLEVLEKIRGTQNALKRLMEKVGEVRHDFEKDVLAVAHSNCEERARSVMEQLLQKYPFKDVIFANMGPVIGTYAGEGGVLIAY
jgi:DegV family protein with EDD domain